MANINGTQAEHQPFNQQLPAKMGSTDQATNPTFGVSASSTNYKLTFIQQYVYTLYFATLLRNPTGQELQDAVDLLNTGCLAQTVVEAAKVIIDSLYTGSYYVGRARTNVQFVSDLYEGILGRPQDTPGATFWLDQLTAGATRQNIIDAQTYSIEHAARLAVFCPSPIPASGQIWPRGART